VKTRAQWPWYLLALGWLLVAFALGRLAILPVHTDVLGASESCPLPIAYLLSNTPDVHTASCASCIHHVLYEVVATGALGVIALASFIVSTQRRTGRPLRHHRRDTTPTKGNARATGRRPSAPSHRAGGRPPGLRR
jgi:hypothetical protein